MAECEIIQIHDDLDMTVLCYGTKYIVTAYGEVFRQEEDLEIQRKVEQATRLAGMEWANSPQKHKIIQETEIEQAQYLKQYSNGKITPSDIASTIR